MQVFDSLSAIPEGFGPTAVTIGKFDGVHAGHRAVIARLMSTAQARSLTSVVVTFDRNPLALLRPEQCPASLLSNEQKLELLAETGVDATLMLTFDAELSTQSASDFVRTVLVVALSTSVVLAGSDFRFGARGAGTMHTPNWAASGVSMFSPWTMSSWPTIAELPPAGFGSFSTREESPRRPSCSADCRPCAAPSFTGINGGALWAIRPQISRPIWKDLSPRMGCTPRG